MQADREAAGARGSPEPTKTSLSRSNDAGLAYGSTSLVTCHPAAISGRRSSWTWGQARRKAEPIEDTVLRSYIGGAGLGTWLMHEHCPPGINELDPRAPLVFVFSPLVGTPLTTSAKFAVVAKSPLTGRLTDALASSHFAIAGKLTGHDAIVLTGACEEPSYVLIDRDEITIEPAGDLWGLPAADAEARLREQHGPAWRVAAIGPAGENGVRYATISHDGRHAGRGGLGAVMGSKLCKAILVRPREKVASADPAGVLAVAKDLRTRSFGASHCQVPRPRHDGEPAGVQRDLDAADAEFHRRAIRRSTKPRGRGNRGPRDSLPAIRARRARSGASTSTADRTARRRGWSTRTCSPSVRCVA